MRVRFRTPWEQEHDGWCQTSRVMTRAMRMVGVDCRLVSWDIVTEPPNARVLAEVEGMLAAKDEGKYDVELISFPLRGPEEAMPFLTSMRIVTRYTPRSIYYTMTERTTLDPEVGKALNSFDEVWVPCRANERVFGEAGVTNVKLVLHPVLEQISGVVKPPSPSFYWIGRWEPRKAPHRLIEAFLREFRPGEATLFIKTLGTGIFLDYPGSAEVVAREAKNSGWGYVDAAHAITVVDGRIPPDAITEIHEKNSVYVSASRGEGVDLPALAAKCHGNRVVCVASGGPEDFVGEGDIVVPAVGLHEVHKDYRFEEGACFVDYDVGDLADGMRMALEPRTSNTWPFENHLPKNVGLRMKRLLEEGLKEDRREAAPGVRFV